MNAMFKFSCLLHLLVVVGDLIDGASGSSVRLRGGETPFEGRVEIFKDGEWGAVCNGGWDIKDAEVVCREVGFPGAMLPSPANYPFQKRKGGSVLITNVECSGTEDSLFECSYSTNTKGCNKNNDAGVFCNFPGYVGCFDDVGYDDGPHSTHSSMTIQRCLSYCRTYGTVYASLMEENCRCGNDLPDNGHRSDNWSCYHSCPGDITQACGKIHNAVYKTSLGACGGKITLTQQEDWILSPEFPDNYPWLWPSMHCEWSIQATLPGTKINVILKMLYLSGIPFFSDSVSLYPIEDRPNNRVTLTRSSGIRGVGDYEIGVTIDNKLDIDFTSVPFSSDIGFAIFYKAFVPGKCEDSDFCQNNGTCFNDGDSDTCVCKEGWTGLHCEDEVDVCHSNPCLNNGTCDYISTGGNYSVYCLCQPGYFGKFCEERITCDNMTVCQNNGTCTIKNNTIYCDCQPGYSGLLCESNITTVLPQPTKQTTAVITRFTRPDQPRVSPSPSSLSNPPSTKTRPGVSPTTLDARSTQTRAFDKSTGDKSQASIIGGSVAVAMVLLIIAVIAVFVICRKRVRTFLKETKITAILQSGTTLFAKPWIEAKKN